MKCGICPKCKEEAVHLAVADVRDFYGDADDDQEDEWAYKPAPDNEELPVKLFARICFQCGYFADVDIERPRDKALDTSTRPRCKCGHLVEDHGDSNGCSHPSEFKETGFCGCVLSREEAASRLVTAEGGKMDKNIDENIFREIAEQIESEWKMGGLSSGMYYDYALEIAKKYIKQTVIWKRERQILLEMTNLLDEHPEGYEGPCLCQECCSCSGEDPEAEDNNNG